jgi:hypothetical protein
MKDKIIELSKELQIDLRENEIINDITFDLLGSISGEIVFTAIYVKDLNTKNIEDLDFLKLSEYTSNVYMRIFFDEQNIKAFDPYSNMRVLVSFQTINDLKDYFLENIKQYSSPKKINIKKEFLEFINKLINLIEKSNYFKPNTIQYLKLQLAKDYLSELPKTRSRNGISIYLETKSKGRRYFYSYDFKIGVTSGVSTLKENGFAPIYKYDFYGKIKYDNGDGTYGRGDEIKFDYPNGQDYQLKDSQLEYQYKSDLEPVISSPNFDLLKIDIF